MDSPQDLRISHGPIVEVSSSRQIRTDRVTVIGTAENQTFGLSKVINRSPRALSTFSVGGFATPASGDPRRIGQREARHTFDVHSRYRRIPEGGGRVLFG